MAHNLEIRDGQASFAAKGEKAWHGLGQYVDKAMTAAEAMELARMDWDVEKRPLFVEEPGDLDGDDVVFSELEGYSAATRTDTGDILSIVSDSYQIVQNRDCFGFFDSIIDREEAIYETAGVLGKGERIFLTAKLPSDIIVKGDVDVVNNYILLTNSHDGTSALQAGFTSIRVVCNNTLTAALNNGMKNSIKLRHTTNIKQMLAEAAEIMGISSKYADELNQSFNAMAKVKITDKQLRAYIEQIMNPRKEQLTKAEKEEFSKQFVTQVDGIMEFALTHDTQTTKAAKGTVWGAYNAISGYYGHMKDHKSATARMNDIMFGQGNQNVRSAFSLAMDTVANKSILS
jgi:phage/plasmid-like protein (TIGR03299 family)